MVARIGGDEFVVVLNGFGSNEARELDRLVKKIQPLLSSSYRIGGQSVRVRVSVGAFEVGPGENDVDHLMKQADLQMYAAKQGGQTILTPMDSAQSGHSNRRKQLERDLMSH